MAGLLQFSLQTSINTISFIRHIVCADSRLPKLLQLLLLLQRLLLLLLLLQRLLLLLLLLQLLLLLILLQLLLLLLLLLVPILLLSSSFGSITVQLPAFVLMYFSTLLLQIMLISVCQFFFDFSFQFFQQATAIHLTFQNFQQWGLRRCPISMYAIKLF